MNKRLISLLGFVLLAILSSFAAISGRAQFKGRSNFSSRPAGIAAKHQLGASSRQASSRLRLHSMYKKPGVPAGLGFLSATQWPAGGSPNSPYPSVMPAATESFDSIGDTGVATVVNDGTSGSKKYAISVVLSNGDGTFQAPQLTNLTTDTQFNPIWTANLNTNGNGDAVMVLEPATVSTPASINVWVNNGDGTFSLGANYPLTTANGDNIIWGTTVTDANTGYVDFVAVDAGSPTTVWTLLGNNNDGFSAPTAAPGPIGSGQLSNVPVAFADFNGDGLLDFVGTDFTSNQLMVYINNGAGYNMPVPLTTPNGLYDACSIAAGDLNNDGFPEIVAANCQDNNVTVYVNNGTGGFSSGTYYYAGRLPEAVAIADINDDGSNDIVAADAFGGDVSVLLGNGDGTLQVPTVGYATGGYPGGYPFGPTYSTVPPLVADFNGDGSLDVVVADSMFSFVYLPGYGDGTFQGPIDYYTQVGVLNPYGAGIASGDFNGDGITDYVIGNNKSYSGGRTGISIFLGNTDGSVQTGTPQGGVATNGVLAYVAVADFQKRGILDIVATDQANGGIQIFNGNGDGTFQTGNTYGSDTQNGYSTLDIAVGDFNGDGYPDIAVVNAYNSGANLDVGVLINDQEGGFKAAVNYAVSTTSQVGAPQILATITAADLNGDGKLDLLVPDFGTQSNSGSTVAVFYGNGDVNGTFQPETAVNTTTNPRYAAVADLNGDGIPDMVLSVDDGATNFQGIDIYLQSPVGTFPPLPNYQYSTQQDTSLHVPIPSYVRVTDVDGDGIPDVVFTDSNYGTVGFLYGKGTGGVGTGQFNGPFEYPVGGNAYNLVLADVNHGGGVNVVTADGNASELTVLLNTAGAPNTLNSSSNPTTAGTSVTFTATVSAIRGVSAVPTGSVTFYDGNTALSGAVPLSSSTASFAASLTGGTHSITSQYSGDTNFFSSTSVALKQVVSLASSSSGVGSSLNPAVPQQSVTFTATVTASGGNAFQPTGNVTFYDGLTALGSGTLNSNGVATLSTGSLAVGSHSITAQYNGDTNFSLSSAQLQQVVTLADSSAGLGSSLNPAAPKQSVTFTATVTNSQQGYVMLPTGTVTFYDGSKALGAAVPISSAGVATFTTSSLTTGHHTITAQYSGDANFKSVGSQAVDENITSVPDYSLSPSPGSQSVNPGSTASYTVTLSPINSYNGTVNFTCPSASSLPSGVTCKAPGAMSAPYQAGTLTLKTTGPSAQAITPQDLKPHRGDPSLWASLSGVGMIGIVLAGDWKKRNRRRLAIVLTILALAMVLAMAGCGGGTTAAGGGGGTGGTPAGTYHVTITATGSAGSNFGNTQPHQLEVTLVVN